ncbi:Ubiquitin-conjugating enzyme E2 S [Pseudocercospora fuligena]|uniref:Ubiquitin-conjugating enzyme E2 S n=1 Tax=Pseudocercospora fuligena TaxID=685502 RepID=A0A8H6VBZ3_9PEZI|nr:Ubiquitin-conjugating enzyme E2 S [Pseudocercospora fuligena]
MNSKALRRLAADHNALHTTELPPYYLFPLNADHADSLGELDILLAGPPATPFAAGVWKLHLSIPPQYPQQPPTANFRTPIFHPNVDPQSGGVCVETLKRDWDSKLTLRDILVTISCLLIYPNPDSALNAEAGALIQEGFDAFARRAELMTSIHATIQPAIAQLVKEAQARGQELVAEESENDEEVREAPARRRRTIARVRGKMRADGSPTGAPTRRREQLVRQAEQPRQQPFVLQAGDDDVFGTHTASEHALHRTHPTEDHANRMEDDSKMGDVDQENDTVRSPPKFAATPKDARTPRRPHGTPVPLQDLILPEQGEFDTSMEDLNTEMEAEYPPSPRKSPSKSASKPRIQPVDFARPESSREAALRQPPTITPPNMTDKPLAEDSPFGIRSVSPRKRPGRGLFDRPVRQTTPDFESSFLQTSFVRPTTPERIVKTKSSRASSAKQSQLRREAELNEKLWELCGRDIKRWNRGEFEGNVFKKKAGRW